MIESCKFTIYGHEITFIYGLLDRFQTFFEI